MSTWFATPRLFVQTENYLLCKGRDHSSLRRPYFRLRPLTIFRNSGLQPFLDQTKYPAIGHAMLDELHSPLVVHVVKETANVRIEYPVHSLPLDAHGQCV